MGSRVDGTASEDNWNDERRLLRSVLPSEARPLRALSADTISISRTGLG